MTHSKPPTAERKLFGCVIAGRLHTMAGIWLFAAVVGPCAERTPTAEPATQPTAASVAAGARSGSTAAAPPAATSAPAASSPVAAVELPGRPQQARTTRSHMLAHYAATVAMRQALVRGKLDDFQAAAATVALDEGTPRSSGDPRPYVAAVRAAARGAHGATSVLKGAAELGKLGEACAACHLKFGGPGSPVAPERLSEGADPSMVAHALATDRLWEGLIQPSDSSWMTGMNVLLDAPRLDSDVADVAAAAGYLRQLAREGKTAPAEQRASIFASVLTTCAGCHERLKVSVPPPPSLE